jgi:hypothetical protein
VTPINQTHIDSIFSSNGTLTLPNTTETINTISNGAALTSLTTQSAIVTETIMTEDGETVIATFYKKKTTKRRKKLQTSMKKEEGPSLDSYIITTVKATV